MNKKIFACVHHFSCILLYNLYIQWSNKPSKCDVKKKRNHFVSTFIDKYGTFKYITTRSQGSDWSVSATCGSMTTCTKRYTHWDSQTWKRKRNEKQKQTNVLAKYWTFTIYRQRGRWAVVTGRDGLGHRCADGLHVQPSHMQFQIFFDDFSFVFVVLFFFAG